MARPILYSFRRCPWAIRARMTLIYSGVLFDLREVDLKNKPVEMLVASPKGTVPVLVLPDCVIDESSEIMAFALTQRDPDGWSLETPAARALSAQWLDDYFPVLVGLAREYKYPERCDSTRVDADERLRDHLIPMNACLQQQSFLLGERIRITDVAMFPMVRQIIRVAPAVFTSWRLDALSRWYQAIAATPFYTKAMEKAAVWQPL